MGMIIDGIAASEHLDSSGEILKIDGHDISDLKEGKGVINWEHQNDSSEDIIGHVTYAHKIMKIGDCEDDRQREYWNICKVPYVYIKAELFDSEEHPGGVAAAALIRYYHKRKMKVLAGFSIEGATLDRSDNILRRSVGRRVALTLRPCNKSAVSGVLSDKSIDSEVKKYMNIDAPSLGAAFEVDTPIFSDLEKHGMSPVQELRKAVADLNKTLTAGSYNVAPSSLTGGAALQCERSKGLSQDSKDRLKKLLSKWDGTSPIREMIKADLPEISDEYVDHFEKLVEEVSLEKKEPFNGFQLSPNPNADFFQASLVEGIDLGCMLKCSGRVMTTTSDVCQKVVLRLPSSDNPMGAYQATRYYELSKLFFDMDGFVVPTNFLSLSGHSSKIEVLDYSGEVFHVGNPAFESAINRAREDGLLHKIALMDIISGINGRSWMEFILKDGRLMTSDNDQAFRYEEYSSPEFLKVIGDDHLDLRAIAWITGLESELLVECMTRLAFDRDVIRSAVKRLETLKGAATSEKTISELLEGGINAIT